MRQLDRSAKAAPDRGHALNGRRGHPVSATREPPAKGARRLEIGRTCVTEAAPNGRLSRNVARLANLDTKRKRPASLRAALCSALALAALAAGPACQREAPAAGQRPAHWPERLVLGYAPVEALAADREEAYAALARHLRRALNLEVGIRETYPYQPAIEAFREGLVDVMQLGPMAYLIAADTAGAEAALCRGRAGPGPLTFRSVLIAGKGVEARSLEEVAAQAGSLSAMLTDPASTSGSLVPRARLRALGLDPDAAFASLRLSGSHAYSILAVAAGKADVAWVYEGRLVSMIESGKIPPDRVSVLWRSDPIPTSPFAIRASLPADLKSAFVESMQALPEKNPELWARFSREPGDILLPCHDRHYDALRALASNPP